MSVKPFELSVSWSKEFKLTKKNGNSFRTLNINFMDTLVKMLECLHVTNNMDVEFTVDEYVILASIVCNEWVVTIYDRVEEESFSFACRKEQIINEAFELSIVLKALR